MIFVYLLYVVERVTFNPRHVNTELCILENVRLRVSERDRDRDRDRYETGRQTDRHLGPLLVNYTRVLSYNGGIFSNIHTKAWTHTLGRSWYELQRPRTLKSLITSDDF